MLTLNATRRLAGGFELSGTAYTRRVRATTINGDLNDDYDPPADTDTGVEHRTGTRSQGVGVAAQLGKTLGAHRLTIGLSYDRARNHFEQDDAVGELDASRSVTVTQATRIDALI